ncbi:uncharacterized protein BYT42DRAFT_487783 [Radiomyces spectabilis]|uniref:uncharacterized protein n=1 Tax=Radiomyces spectabilis TaxID=64574 RepID=UPI00221EC0BE|nr:uncharacterized protein BYT42DRAFT_487783 [Radiomyces spectabilis]KAI8394272.1 hypothetical protein BYT42DRAFT_487783 [Radiomyces spectabilis]
MLCICVTAQGSGYITKIDDGGMNSIIYYRILEEALAKILSRYFSFSLVWIKLISKPILHTQPVISLSVIYSLHSPVYIKKIIICIDH